MEANQYLRSPLSNYYSVFDRVLLVLLIYVFFFGIVQLAGAPNSVQKFTIDFLVLLLFLLSRKKLLPGIKLFLIFSLLFLISSIINDSDLFNSLTLYRTFLYPYLIFLFIYNSKNYIGKYQHLIKFIIVLFIFQILGAIVKYFIFGITEKGLIGFISVSSGSYSTILPLFAICFLLSIYLFADRSYKTVLYIIGFLFIGLVGAKRGIWLYFPIVVLFAWIFFLKLKQKIAFSQSELRVLIFLVVVGISVFIFGVKYNRTLNPEAKKGGSINLEYVQNYAIEYTFTGEEQGKSTGRGTNFLIVIKNMSHGPLNKILFGYGPDKLKGTSTYGEGIWGEFGINGPVTGFTGKIVQIGLLANIIVLIAFYKMGKIFYDNTKKEPDRYWKAISFGGFLATLLFYIDYLTYSSSYIYTLFPISFSYFICFAIILKKNRKHFVCE